MTQYTEAGTESFDVEVINPDNNSSVHELDCAPTQPTQPAQATEAATPNTQTGFFPFLKLPRELRDQIYHHSVVCHSPISIERSTEHNFKHQTPPETISIPLARVCKQVHTEVIPLLYSKNTFSFYSDNYMYDFITHFAPHTNLISCLIVARVESWNENNRTKFRIDEIIANLSCLLPLKNLKSLQLTALFEMNREDALPMFANGIRGWAEAVGARAGDRYKALDVIRGSAVLATRLGEDEHLESCYLIDALKDEELEEELRRLL